MTLHDRPHADELLDAVREFLQTSVAPVLPEELTFPLLVSCNVLKICAREASLGSRQEREHAERLQSLGFADDAELSAALRAGAVPASLLPAVRAAVTVSVSAKLAVANPGYAGVSG